MYIREQAAHPLQTQEATPRSKYYTRCSAEVRGQGRSNDCSQEDQSATPKVSSKAFSARSPRRPRMVDSLHDPRPGPPRSPTTLVGQDQDTNCGALTGEISGGNGSSPRCTSPPPRTPTTDALYFD
uniref:Uncharacterized protein n=1 Tax=Haemonchus contortus TaxID=6289 RepID=A0A7I4YXC3_HAECO